MEKNKNRCENEISRVHEYYEAILGKLDKIKKKHEKSLRDSLESKNADVRKDKSSLEEKKKKYCRILNI